MTGKSQTNLIVNYLPQTLTDEEFTSMFESVGPLNASKIVRDRATGYSYGFGFVDFVNVADAMRAVDTLNGLQLQNKQIKVAYARTGENVKGGNLYVRNLPVALNQYQVKEIFIPFGVVVQCRILSDQATGVSKGIGFVLFETRDQAQAAINSLNGHVLEGHTEALSVQFAEDNKGKARPPASEGMPSRGRGSYTPRGRGSFGGAPRGRGGYVSRGGGARGGGGYGAVDRGRGYGAARGAYNGGAAGYDSSYEAGYDSSYVAGYDSSYGSGYDSSYGSGYDNSYGSGYDNYESGYGPMRTQTQNRGRYNPMSGGGGGGGSANYNSGYTSFDNGNGASKAAAEGEGHVLFAYNIGGDTDENALWQLFSPFGAIEKVNVIRDAEKGTGKGYGFVTMSDYQEASSAIQALSGYMYSTKPLQVSFKAKKA